jgi:hypothetical protein
LLSPPQIAMKAPEFDPNSDRNWAWPEKTWFRERLNALRAREQEAHRKPVSNQKESVAMESKGNGNGDRGTEKG